MPLSSLLASSADGLSCLGSIHLALTCIKVSAPHLHARRCYGTTCSHADWEGPALAAAQVAEKMLTGAAERT